MIRFIVTSGLIAASGIAGFALGTKVGSDAMKLLCEARDALRDLPKIPSDDEAPKETEDSEP